MADMSTSKTVARLTRRLEAAERERQVQSAVDRILRQALAMEATEDIPGVVVETRDALVSLGVVPEFTHISIFDKARDLATGWGAWLSGDAFSIGEYVSFVTRFV